MRIIPCLAITAGAAVLIGFLVALLAKPALSRRTDRSSRRRRVMCVGVSGLAALIWLWLMSELLIELWIDENRWLIPASPSSQALRLELWLRLVVPRVFDGHCITGRTAICEFVDARGDWHDLDYLLAWGLLFVLPALSAALTTAWAVWRWTTPYQRDSALSR